MSPPLLLGNPVFGGAPTELPPPTGGPGGGWTAIQEYDEQAGDLAAIAAAYSIRRISGFFFSPDGTLFTLANTSDDNIKTFSLSTPWDLNTATEIASIAVSNPGNLKVNGDGTRMFAIIIVGDEIAEYALSPAFTVNNNTQQSDVTKSNVGFTGTADGRNTTSEDFTRMLWEGQDGGGDAIKEMTIVPDLDSFVVDQTYNNGAINPGAGGFSPLTKDGRIWFRCVGSPGIRWREMTTPYDPSTVIDWNLTYDLKPLTVMAVRPDHAWFNPSDTSEIWIGWDTTNRMRFVRFATNAP